MKILDDTDGALHAKYGGLRCGIWNNVYEMSAKYAYLITEPNGGTSGIICQSVFLEENKNNTLKVT